MLAKTVQLEISYAEPTQTFVWVNWAGLCPIWSSEMGWALGGCSMIPTRPPPWIFNYLNALKPEFYAKPTPWCQYRLRTAATNWNLDIGSILMMTTSSRRNLHKRPQLPGERGVWQGSMSRSVQQRGNLRAQRLLQRCPPQEAVRLSCGLHWKPWGWVRSDPLDLLQFLGLSSTNAMCGWHLYASLQHRRELRHQWALSAGTLHA